MPSQTIVNYAKAHMTDGRLSAGAVQSLLESTGRSLDEILLELVDVARRFSRAGLSNFHVGAVAEGESGSLYLAGNIELPSVPLSYTIHAEQAAVIRAGRAGESDIRQLALSTAPCGYCRQFLAELEGAEALRILVPDQAPVVLPELLPVRFGPDDLQVTQRLLQSSPHHLRWQNVDAEDDLADEALQAASHSYAPYSKSPAGVAVRTLSDSVFRGSYLENAAFNPSISPLQAALTELVIAGESPDAICDLVLVQLVSSQVDHASECRYLLDQIAPEAEFRCLSVE